MKITVDVDENYIENEVVIKCSEINEEIINLQKILSTRNAINTKIEFKNTHKNIFVSRGYFKPLKNKIDEIRSIT